MTPSGRTPIAAVVVGYGYWGPNLVRNVVESPDLRLAALCEQDEARAADFHRRHPAVGVEEDLDVALTDAGVDAVIVATPPNTHYPLVKRALEAGKHVLVEKPLARTGPEALDLINTARQRGLVLMPGHTFVYSPSVEKVRELIRQDALGEVYFVTSSRMNLGKYQPDGVVCDLAPHDLSILAHWLDEPLVHVSATGRSVFQDDVPETAFLTLTFASGAKANVQISWLAPRKVRQMVVVGSRRMLHYEDTSSDESVRLYDRGLEFEEPPSNFGEYRLTYRSGDMVAPCIDAAEPLGLELQDFARSIREGSEPRSSATLGLEIVLALEALEQSLNRRGEPVAVRSAAELLDAGAQFPASGNGHAGNGYNGNGSGRNGNGSGRNGNGHDPSGHNGNGHNGNGGPAGEEGPARPSRIADRRPDA